MLPSPDPDFLVLQSDPHRLVQAYQGLIEKVVGKYVRSGMFDGEFASDVKQTVNAELLQKMPSIQAHYNGSTLVRTYVAAVIRNICLQLHNAEKYAVKSEDTPLGENWHPPAPEVDRYSIEQARKVYGAIMRQFGLELPKLLICLKLRYHIQVQETDILRWYPQCNAHLVRQILERLGPDSSGLKYKDIYSFVTPIFNLVENKDNTPWAVRRWTADRVTEIINLLNSSIPDASFDDSTLRILIEDYFSPFLLKE